MRCWTQDDAPEPPRALDLDALKMQTARRRMVVAWAFTVPIIVLMLLHMVFGIAWPSMMAVEIALMALALPVLVWPGGPTFRSAWNSAHPRQRQHGRADCHGHRGLLDQRAALAVSRRCRAMPRWRP